MKRMSANHRYTLCPVDQSESSNFVALNSSAFLSSFPCIKHLWLESIKEKENFSKRKRNKWKWKIRFWLNINADMVEIDSIKKLIVNFYRTWRTKSWRPTFGLSNFGEITNLSGTLRNTVELRVFMFQLITFGDLTLSFTTSKWLNPISCGCLN